MKIKPAVENCLKLEASTVELIDSMGSDLSVCNAARVSFHKESKWENDKEEFINDFDLEDKEFFYKNPEFEGQLGIGDQKLVQFLAKHNHFSPFCHAFLSFRIKTHIVNARQLVKHQVGLSWNEVSRRYVDDEPTFFMPEAWRTRPASVKQGSSETETVTYFKPEFYSTQPNSWPEFTISQVVADHYENSLALYEDMIEAGVAPEQARGILPLFMNTEWIWSGSLAAFARVYSLRIDSHAQKEVRDIAEIIGKLIPNNMQHSWAALTNKE